MGKKSHRTRKSAPEIKTPTCEIFGCDCTQVYKCRCCEKRVCAAHFLGMEGVVNYDDGLPIGLCAKCPFCKKVNNLATFNTAALNKLKSSLSEFTKSNGDIEFDLGAAAEVRGDYQGIGSVTLKHSPCPYGCCAGKLHFALSSTCTI